VYGSFEQFTERQQDGVHMNNKNIILHYILGINSSILQGDSFRNKI